MYSRKKFVKKDRVHYNTEGLNHLYWELFDSPDAEGSAYRFMEREPVLILDDIFSEFPNWHIRIDLAYTSQRYGDILGLPTSSPFRVGKAVKISALNPAKRIFIVKNLIIRGIDRIGVSDKYVYFDTENYLKKPALYVH